MIASRRMDGTPISRVARRVLGTLAALVVFSAVVDADTATITGHNGRGAITPSQLSEMLAAHIPGATPKLLVFSQCYGGNIADAPAFRRMANTAITSGTSPGQQGAYGGYHDDAARALRPGTGRTAMNVHRDGFAGRMITWDGQGQFDREIQRLWGDNPIQRGGLPLVSFPLDIRIENCGGLDKSEIDRMKADAGRARRGRPQAPRADRPQEPGRRPDRRDPPPARRARRGGERRGPAGRSSRAIVGLEGSSKEEDQAAIEAGIKELQEAGMELGKAVYEAEAAKAAAAGEAAGEAGGQTGAAANLAGNLGLPKTVGRTAMSSTPSLKSKTAIKPDNFRVCCCNSTGGQETARLVFFNFDEFFKLSRNEEREITDIPYGESVFTVFSLSLLHAAVDQKSAVAFFCFGWSRN